MYRLRGGGIFTVLDSAGGRKKNKDMFSALLRLLEMFQRLAFFLFMECFRHEFCRQNLGDLNLREAHGEVN